MERFTLTIECGNEAMSTLGHIATALRAVAERIDSGNAPGWVPYESPIRDENGNTVGSFEVV